MQDGPGKDGRRGPGGNTLPYRMETKAHRINGNGQLLVESGRKFPTSLEELGSLVKDEKSPSQKSCKESVKREQEVLVEKERKRGREEERKRGREEERKRGREEERKRRRKKKKKRWLKICWKKYWTEGNNWWERN